MRVKALISSVASRTALACSLLSVFYPREELAGKRLKDLDQKVVSAIAGTFNKDETNINQSAMRGYSGTNNLIKPVTIFRERSGTNFFFSYLWDRGVIKLRVCKVVKDTEGTH